jgi:hypothetical protein
MSNDDQSPQQPRDSLSWPDVSKPSTGHQPPYGYPREGPTGPLPSGYGSPPPYKGGGPGGRIALLVAILLAVTVAAGVLGWLIFK